MSGRDRIELLLSIGASRTEAMKGVLQRALTAALTPALNTMSVVGLVSIPEFMSGQLAGDQSPMQVSQLPFPVPCMLPLCEFYLSPKFLLEEHPMLPPPLPKHKGGETC